MGTGLHGPSGRVAAWGAAMVMGTLLSGCGKPAFPDAQAVRERFHSEHRALTCELTRIHPPAPQPDQAGHPALYVHVRFEARCKDQTGVEETLVRQQVWKLDRKPPTQWQEPWRWTPAGEISG